MRPDQSQFTEPPSGTDRGPAYLRVKRVLLCLSYRQWRLYLWHTAHSGIEPSHLTLRRWHSRHARDSSGCPFWDVAGVGASDCGRSISGVCKPDMAHRRTIQSQFGRAQGETISKHVQGGDQPTLNAGMGGVAGYLINFAESCTCPDLAPSCLVLFLPRVLLHPYIHLAGNACKK